MRISLEKALACLPPALAWVGDYYPRVLGADWSIAAPHGDGAMFVYRGVTGALSVIVSGCVEGDSRRWLHVSLARPDRLPSYDDLCMVKALFIGRDKTALQVFPPAAQHVNIHEYCLHLFHCVDGDVTPDFTQGKRRL